MVHPRQIQYAFKPYSYRLVMGNNGISRLGRGEDQ